MVKNGNDISQANAHMSHELILVSNIKLYKDY